MHLRLGGHLSWYDPQKRSSFEVSLVQPTLLMDVVQKLGLPVGEIAMAVVNGQVVSMDQTRLMDEDRVELYPPIGGG